MRHSSLDLGQDISEGQICRQFTERRMPTARLPFKSLDELLAHVPITNEDPETDRLIKRLEHVKIDRELSRREFLAICRWKSPRSKKHYERTPAAAIGRTVRKVYGTRSEKTRLELLTGLRGVSVPTASAILTLTNPQRYGVIDIRVWQLLYALRSVGENPMGQGFTFSHWRLYLQILRRHAKRLKVPVRLIELTLFTFHRDHQTATLYPSR